MPIQTVLIIAFSFIFLWLASLSWLFRVAFKIAPQGFALIRSGYGGTFVAFDKLMVFPILHKLDYLDMRNKHLDIVCENQRGVICYDNTRVNLRMRFTLQISQDVHQIVKVSQSIGCERAGQITTLHELFEAKFLEAIKTVTTQFNYQDLLRCREEYKHTLLKVIGDDLNGFVLFNCSITHISLTPSEYIDPDTLIGAEGLKVLKQRLAQVYEGVKLKQNIEQQMTESHEQDLLIAFQKAEKTALHEIHIRHLREQGELDARLIHLEVKHEAETSSSIRWRLKKQLDELKQKRQGLKTQFEMEEKSVKILYQRKLLAMKRRDKLPPEK